MTRTPNPVQAPRDATTYKTRRTTLALALASAHFAKNGSDDFHAAAKIVVGNHYDFARCEPQALEMIYAYLDDAAMSEVREEFIFIPSLGNIRDHGAHVAYCALCGKGDSREDGGNEDRLRYDFKLSNVAGGTDLWVGSTCIVNFGLKVRGAETSEDARKLLQQSLRSHMAEWKRAAWRESYPQHAKIREHHEALQAQVRTLQGMQWDAHWRHVLEISGMIEIRDGYRRSPGFWFSEDAHKAYKALSTSLRFYLKEHYLTPAKHTPWERAMLLIDRIAWLLRMYEETKPFQKDDQKIADHLELAKAQRDGLRLASGA